MSVVWIHALQAQQQIAPPSPPFETATRPGPTQMRPYGQSGGCSEEPTEFHRCAMAKAAAFNVLHVEATIDDPTVFTRPWTIAFGLKREPEPATKSGKMPASRA